jgi:hypothetical protein
MRRRLYRIAMVMMFCALWFLLVYYGWVSLP